MKVDTFLYYGAIIDKPTLENYIKTYNMTDIYSYVYSNGLQYKNIGDASNSEYIIVGKELYWDLGSNLSKVYQKNDEWYIGSNYIKTSNIDNETKIEVDRKEINQKLLLIGITETPDIYLFNSWIK